jgi:glucosamine--fructose-6-phosphate aminotransferase (isomerizing)
MCGIVGYLGSDLEGVESIISGLELLQNRGYDSVGISTIKDGELITIKYASTHINDALSLVKDKANIYKKQKIAIGHTRWATHGSKTDINAHPHNDISNQISIVHNGIIENYSSLKIELQKRGYTFKSSTDTEVISILIGEFLDKHSTMIEAIRKTVEILKGTWALVIINKNYPNKIWAVRNGSPLLLGTSPSCIMLASEHIAFHKYINKYIVLKDNDVLEIEQTGSEFIYNKSLSKYKTQSKIEERIEITPSPFRYWMLKEINEQPDAVIRAINNGARILSETTVRLGGLDSCISRLIDREHLIILGCGTSYHAGMWSLDLFKSLKCFNTVSLYDGADFNVNDIPNNGKTVAIMLSQSGETKDLQRCIKIINEMNIVSIGVVNVIDSFIARETMCGVYLNAGREVAVASTKSFTNQCVVLSLISVWFSQIHNTCEDKRRKIIYDLDQLNIQIKNVFSICNQTNIKEISKIISNKSSLFILGKGKEESIALEGSLKIKEIAYIHAEGYSTSALKHGPFGLLEPDMPVIVIDVSDEYRNKNANAISEIKARDANVLIISDKSEDSVCIMDSNPTYGGLIANIFLQWISYECAVIKGLSPDFPRNLAKVVSVE